MAERPSTRLEYSPRTLQRHFYRRGRPGCLDAAGGMLVNMKLWITFNG